MPFHPATKCFLFAWVPAWGAATFLASALIAAVELTPAAEGCASACTFAVADAMSPQAKIAFGALLCILMLLARRPRARDTYVQAIRDALAGAVAAILVLALLPAGFGIAFFNPRFLPAANAIYPAAAALGGVLGTLLERSCRRQLVG